LEITKEKEWVGERRITGIEDDIHGQAYNVGVLPCWTTLVTRLMAETRNTGTKGNPSWVGPRATWLNKPAGENMWIGVIKGKVQTKRRMGGGTPYKEKKRKKKKGNKSQRKKIKRFDFC